jgi:hypothetical protein
MRRPGRAQRLSVFSVLAIGAALALTVQGGLGATAATRAAGAGVAPRAVGELDCNGLSKIQKPVKNVVTCLDPRGSEDGRFEDNGHYIGHDEPSVRFISNRPGSGAA